MSPEGKPIQVNASALQAAAAQNAVGMYQIINFKLHENSFKYIIISLSFHSTNMTNF